MLPVNIKHVNITQKTKRSHPLYGHHHSRYQLKFWAIFHPQILFSVCWVGLFLFCCFYFILFIYFISFYFPGCAAKKPSLFLLLLQSKKSPQSAISFIPSSFLQLPQYFYHIARTKLFLVNNS